MHSGLEIISGARIEPPIPGSLFHDDTVHYTMSALFLGKHPMPPCAPPTPVIRPSSFISQVHISELPHRMNRKIFAQSSAVQQTAAQLQVQDRALAERLSEIEKVSEEAKRRAQAIDLMTLEIRERERVIREQERLIRELHDTAHASFHTIEQLDHERQVQQQAAEERLRALEETGAALSQSQAALQQSLSEAEMLKAKCVALENENLLTYVRRRRKNN